ncbi:unnamed protein product [Cochlearia groenlandica]
MISKINIHAPLQRFDRSSATAATAIATALRICFCFYFKKLPTYREITEIADKCCLYALPDLLINTLLQPLRVNLRSQRVTKPMMWCTLAAVAFHVPLNYWLVMVKLWGVPGVAIASVVTNLIMVSWSESVVEVVGGGLGPLMRVAVPSNLGICLEWWWYEIVTVMGGYLENPKLTVAATGILIQTSSLMYTIPMSLAGCVSAREMEM